MRQTRADRKPTGTRIITLMVTLALAPKRFFSLIRLKCCTKNLSHPQCVAVSEAAQVEDVPADPPLQLQVRLLNGRLSRMGSRICSGKLGRKLGRIIKTLSLPFSTVM